MKNSILLITLLCNIVITISAKNVYTYNIVQKNPKNPNIQDEPEKNQYAYPGYTYNFTVNVKDYNGSAIGKFRLKLTNGKFDNDSSTISIFNGETAIAFWQDSANINAEIKVISTSLYEPDRDSLIAGVNQIMYTKIASLKGQTPVLTFNGNPNQAIGNKQQFSATVNEMIYPGIMDTIIGIIRNRRVEFYKWKLPDGWKTTTGISGEFITDTRQVDIIPDYVNRGNITVTGVNYLKSGFSETTSYFADRGFSFINYPISITFGDITPKTFGTTLFNSITYEWSAPSNWQINGQGNLLEAINLNYVIQLSQAPLARLR